MQSQLVPKEEAFAFVSYHIRQQILGMATNLHHGLKEVRPFVSLSLCDLMAASCQQATVTKQKKHKARSGLFLRVQL